MYVKLVDRSTHGHWLLVLSGGGAIGVVGDEYESLYALKQPCQSKTTL